MKLKQCPSITPLSRWGHGAVKTLGFQHHVRAIAPSRTVLLNAAGHFFSSSFLRPRILNVPHSDQNRLVSQLRRRLCGQSRSFIPHRSGVSPICKLPVRWLALLSLVSRVSSLVFMLNSDAKMLLLNILLILLLLPASYRSDAQI